MCASVERAGREPASAVHQDELWVVHPIPQGNGVPGWLLVQSRRHVAGIQELDAAEAASLGPLLVRLQRVLIEVTGAERIYTASLNESAPHLHIHLAPRYATMPADATGFRLFDLLRATASGEIPADREGAARIADQLRARLADDGADRR
jgi:diadenosine tetraphosphate (Ap4A) HIT family hydrolase